MKVVSFGIIFYFLCFSSCICIASQDANGCGTERFGWLVPDSTLLSKCVFKNACNNHDICYGKCLEGGDLFGKQTCNNNSERKQRRHSCDVMLKTDIIADNTNYICHFYASIYSWAVKTFGEENFFGIEGQQQAYVQEFNKFLEYLERNPTSFDLPAIERDLKRINISAIKNNTTVIVKFISYIPELSVVSINDSGLSVLLKTKGVPK